MKAKMFTSWSFSRYGDYKLCPLKAKLKHLDKIAEPKNDAMQRGIDVHDQASGFIKGTIKKLSPELTQFKAIFTDLRKRFKSKLRAMVVEDGWNFTKDWHQTVWNDWANCVLRVKVDLGDWLDDVTLLVTDWKTGKFRAELNEEYVEQLELYALAAFMTYPHLAAAHCRLAYTDQGVFYPEKKPLIFTRKDIPRLKKMWAARTKPMLNDTTFAPRPNDKCKWCWYGQSKKRDGGPGLCKF